MNPNCREYSRFQAFLQDQTGGHGGPPERKLKPLDIGTRQCGIANPGGKDADAWIS
jgi:hypothetical protein